MRKLKSCRDKENQSKSDKVRKNNKTWSLINEKLWLTCKKEGKAEQVIEHAGLWLVWSRMKVWMRMKKLKRSWSLTEMRKTILSVFSDPAFHFSLTDLPTVSEAGRCTLVLWTSAEPRSPHVTEVSDIHPLHISIIIFVLPYIHVMYGTDIYLAILNIFVIPLCVWGLF